MVIKNKFIFLPFDKHFITGESHKSKKMGSDDFREYREQQKARRVDRLPVRQAEIESLRELGYEVIKLTEYQYRINDIYDLYPIHNRWHNIKNNRRGGAQNLKQFIISSIKL